MGLGSTGETGARTAGDEGDIELMAGTHGQGHLGGGGDADDQGWDGPVHRQAIAFVGLAFVLVGDDRPWWQMRFDPCEDRFDSAHVHSRLLASMMSSLAKNAAENVLRGTFSTAFLPGETPEPWRLRGPKLRAYGRMPAGSGSRRIRRRRPLTGTCRWRPSSPLPHRAASRPLRTRSGGRGRR
ncbi:hypothetical protein BAURA63_02647 [Brevibacterium aurantiacum]|uniref:Uncharacterized protein n=1 Tax=Brevibacterium aurantiacum TaxID=273384 RepID=A0A2H1JUD8_BREAU|nr:hypothetical protein BAURA63_02647 [Brevibacterium aurantiacum]